MKTKIISNKQIVHGWKVVDANGKTLGRLATRVACMLMGKDKPAFSPHQDHGDFVVVVNAEKIRVTGNKAEYKTYFTHTGHVGHEKLTPYKEILAKKPGDIIRHAVKGMIQTKGPLGRAINKKLFIYAGETHPHTAQQPQAVNI